MRFRKSLFYILVLTVLFPAVVTAQYIEQIPEITAGNFFGYGARAMAMGGAGMHSYDGNAMFHNPACLARIPRIEFSGGVSLQDYSDNSAVRDQRRMVDYTGAISSDQVLAPRFEGFTPVRGSASSTKSDSRLNSAVLVIPYPTYRGSLVFAFGMARTANFDRTFRLSHYDSADSGSIIDAVGDEFQSGGLMQYGAAMGIDLSPRLSCGFGLYYYNGKHDYNWDYYLDSLPDYSYRQEDIIADDYSGWNLKASLLFRANRYVSISMAIETPLKLSVEEDARTYYDGEDAAYVSTAGYEVKRPFVFSGGASIEFGQALFTAEADYTDWSQLEYSGNAIMESYNNEIKQYYDNALRIRAGAEYVFPSMGLSLRGGLYRDPLPFKDQFINDNRVGYTAGFGVLIDQVITIDLAWVHGSYNRNSDFIYSSVYDGDDLQETHNLIVDEDISYDRIFITSAYRF